MPKTLPFSVIQKNIVDQLQASQEIFALVSDLADVAENAEKEQQKQALETAMQKLLNIGENLSNAATRTGDKVLQLAGGDKV